MGAGKAAEGIIETTNDVDVFKFTTQGSYQLDIKSLSQGANLDIMAVLKDSAGQVVAQSNDPTVLNAKLLFDSPVAKDYYLEVSGVGAGNPLTTGYTDYASLGYYSIDLIKMI